MINEVVYVCHSTNNKNIRANELEVLRKYEDKLYFEFGENENNIKKRFYNDIETLNKDFEEILKIKNKVMADELVTEAKERDLITSYEDFLKTDLAKETAEENSIVEEKKTENKKKSYKKYSKKDLF